jgi:hypothetical protein
MKKIQGITSGVAIDEDNSLSGIITIKHSTLKEGNLKTVHKDLEYGLDVAGLTFNDLCMLAGSDLRIYLAGIFRETSDTFVESLHGKTWTLADLEGEREGRTGQKIKVVMDLIGCDKTKAEQIVADPVRWAKVQKALEGLDI